MTTSRTCPSCGGTHVQVALSHRRRYGLYRRLECCACGHRWTDREAQTGKPPADDTRALLLWLLWHHQGARSDVGQPIRDLLGMERHEPMSDEQLRIAREWGDQWLRGEKKTLAQPHPAPSPATTPEPQPGELVEPEITRRELARIWNDNQDPNEESGDAMARLYSAGFYAGMKWQAELAGQGDPAVKDSLTAPPANTIAGCGGPCEEDFRLCNCGLLQQLNPQHTAPTTEARPSGLVERVAGAIHPSICADPNLYLHEARAAIREVAKSARGLRFTTAQALIDWLEREAR